VTRWFRFSKKLVKAHMRSILAKLSANDRTHAVMIGILELQSRATRHRNREGNASAFSHQGEVAVG
jgi:hypothetical protein